MCIRDRATPAPKSRPASTGLPSRLLRKNPDPVRFPVDHFFGQIEHLVKLVEAGNTVVGGSLALGAINDQAETWAAAGSNPLQHLQVVIRIAKRGDLAFSAVQENPVPAIATPSPYSAANALA